MRTKLDFVEMQRDLWNYAESASRYGSPIDDGTFIGYAAEMEFSIEDNIQMLDFCDPDNIQAHLFLQIADHWLQIRRDFPSGILAFKQAIPRLTDPNSDLNYETITRVQSLVTTVHLEMVKDYKRLKRENYRLLKSFLKFRIGLEVLDPVQRSLQRRNYECVDAVILPCLYRLGHFLTESFTEFISSKRKWKRFQKETSKSALESFPLPNISRLAEDQLTQGIFAFIFAFCCKMFDLI